MKIAVKTLESLLYFNLSRNRLELYEITDNDAFFNTIKLTQNERENYRQNTKYSQQGLKTKNFIVVPYGFDNQFYVHKKLIQKVILIQKSVRTYLVRGQYKLIIQK